MNKNWYMNDFYQKASRENQKSNDMNIKHREACPSCGKRLVNIYYDKDKWQCKKCWEFENKLERC